MKVLAIQQPWASLITHGYKTIELRSRPTNIRETIAIYASRAKVTNQERNWVIDCIHNLNIQVHPFPPSITSHEFPKGQIIATAEIVEVFQYNYRDSFNSDTHRHLAGPDWYFEGIYGWILHNVTKIQPIDFKFTKGQIVWSSTKQQFTPMEI